MQGIHHTIDTAESVVYHPNTGHLAGISVVPALIVWYPVGIFCTVGFGGNAFLKFLGTLKKNCGKPFSLKRGAECSKRDMKSPFLERKKGSRQFFDTEMYQPIFLLVLVGKLPRKYQPIPTKNTK